MSGLYHGPPTKLRPAARPPLTLDALEVEREELKRRAFGKFANGPPAKLTAAMRRLLDPLPSGAQAELFARNKAYRHPDTLRGAAAWAYRHDFAALHRLGVVHDWRSPDRAIIELVTFEAHYCWASVVTGGRRDYLPPSVGARQLAPCPSVARVLRERGIDHAGSAATPDAPGA